MITEILNYFNYINLRKLKLMPMLKYIYNKCNLSYVLQLYLTLSI